MIDIAMAMITFIVAYLDLDRNSSKLFFLGVTETSICLGQTCLNWQNVFCI